MDIESTQIVRVIKVAIPSGWNVILAAITDDGQIGHLIKNGDEYAILICGVIYPIKKPWWV